MLVQPKVDKKQLLGLAQHVRCVTVIVLPACEDRAGQLLRVTRRL